MNVKLENTANISRISTLFLGEDAQCAAAVCSQNVAINIKVTIVRQTIKLNPLYILSTRIHIFHDNTFFLPSIMVGTKGDNGITVIRK